MKIEKLLDSLNDYLTKGGKKKTVQFEQIDELLDKLEDKKKKLKAKLKAETNATKKKRLATDLKIVTLQLKKGYKRRDELKGKLK